MSTVTSGVVNHRGVRAPASGMVPFPTGNVTSRRFVSCVSVRDVVTVAVGNTVGVLTNTKRVGSPSGPPSFTSGETWL